MTVYISVSPKDGKEWSEICKDVEDGKDPHITFRGVDYAKVMHGRWDLCEVDGLGKRVKCSICGEKIWTLDTDDERYCCHCGARMDGGEEHDKGDYLERVSLEI